MAALQATAAAKLDSDPEFLLFSPIRLRQVPRTASQISSIGSSGCRTVLELGPAGKSVSDPYYFGDTRRPRDGPIARRQFRPGKAAVERGRPRIATQHNAIVGESIYEEPQSGPHCKVVDAESRHFGLLTGQATTQKTCSLNIMHCHFCSNLPLTSRRV